MKYLEQTKAGEYPDEKSMQLINDQEYFDWHKFNDENVFYFFADRIIQYDSGLIWEWIITDSTKYDIQEIIEFFIKKIEEIEDNADIEPCQWLTDNF